VECGKDAVNARLYASPRARWPPPGFNLDVKYTSIFFRHPRPLCWVELESEVDWQMQQVQQLQQLQHHSNTLEHELRTARRSGAADDSKRVTDHLAVDDSRRAAAATRSTMPTTSYERRLPCPEPRDIHTAAPAREDEEGHHSAEAKSAAHVCRQAGMKLRTYLGDIDEHKYLPTYTHRQAAVAASPYTGKQCHTHARAALRGIAPSPHVADTWLAQSDL